MTPEEIRRVEFEPVRKGYSPEDVDDFLQHVATDMEKLEAERDAAIKARDEARQERDNAQAAKQALEQGDSDRLAQAIAAKEEAEAKMYVLAEKVEEYRGQEDTLKTALINAQRMGETVVYEAKQKADQMLREATGQTDLLRQKAEMEIARERETLENMLGEVNRFKTTILNLYKQHIESLSALDAPTERAEALLKETVQYKNSEEILDPAAGTPMGTAEPEIPAKPEPVIIPHGVPQHARAEMAAEAAAEAPAEEKPEAAEEAPAAPEPVPAYEEAPAFQPVNSTEQAATGEDATMEYTVPDIPQP